MKIKPVEIKFGSFDENGNFDPWKRDLNGCINDLVRAVNELIEVNNDKEEDVCEICNPEKGQE
jgi:hypothetical protein